MANNSIDLNTVNISINNGEVEHEEAITELADFLEDGTIYTTSTNTKEYREYGIQSIEFKDGLVYIEGKTPYQYKIENNIYTGYYPGGSEQQTFIYVTSDLTLSVFAEYEDLNILSHSKFGDLREPQPTPEFVKSDFVGKTFYFVFDDFIDTYHDSKISETAPTLVKMEFSESDVAITFEESEYKDEGAQTLSWEIFDGMLKILEGNGEIADRDLIFARSISDQNITVLLDTKPSIAPLLLIEDQNLAQSIYEKWIKATD